MVKKKAAKKKSKGPDKRKILLRFVEPPKTGLRMFWPKEMSLFNKLLESYPELDFWEKIPLDPLKSLAQAFAYPYDGFIKRKYQEYKMFIPKKIEIQIGKKVGPDIEYRKKKTLLDFLNGKDKKEDD